MLTTRKLCACKFHSCLTPVLVLIFFLVLLGKCQKVGAGRFVVESKVGAGPVLTSGEAHPPLGAPSARAYARYIVNVGIAFGIVRALLQDLSLPPGKSASSVGSV